MAGFDNNVMYADNVDFTGSVNPSATVTSAGKLMIGTGSTPAIAIGSLTSPDSSVTVGYSSPNVTLQVSGGSTTGKTITGNSGGALPPTLGNWNISTSNSTIKFVGSGSTLTQDFGKTNLVLGNSLASLTTGVDNVGLGNGVLAKVTSGQLNFAGGTSALANLIDGFRNVAIGVSASGNPASIQDCVAIGWNAGISCTGSQNCFIGSQAWTASSTGAQNAVVGFQAGVSATSADSNAGIGYAVLNAMTTGDNNTACGWESLFSITTGSNNTALGRNSGASLTTSDSSNVCIANAGTSGDNNTIRIGTQGSGAGQQNQTFIAGIYGVTTTASPAIPVLVSSTGQLGTVSSSRRFKQNILPMANLSERIHSLNPIIFEYIQSPGVKSYGLIAEEVDEVMPELVVRDEHGEILTVRYNELIPLLLNEVQQLRREVNELRNK